MNLATRCTACGTIFRVVQDQLKVSAGWVRCGRCQAVFNAQNSLFDLEREAPPPWDPEAAERTAASDSPDDGEAEHAHSESDEAAPDFDTDSASMGAPPAEARHSPDVDDPEIDLGGGESSEEAPLPAHAPAADAEASTETTGAETTASDFDSSAIDSAGAGAPSEAAADAGSAPDSSDVSSPEAAPDFMRQAQRDERWQQGPVRAALLLLAVLLALGLAVQVIEHFRHRIAAQWPETTPWLQRYCAAFQCRIEPMRRIDDVIIENTALTQGDPALQDGGGANALRLTVALRNRGPLPVAMPSVDLSLTGADGELVSRRSLSPSEFRVADPMLKPSVDALLSIDFSVTGRRVTGYTVEVFYP